MITASASCEELVDSKIELLEHEEIYQLRNSIYKKDLNELKQLELETNYQKLMHIRFCKLLADENISRYNHNPVLNSRYVLMYLIGKGGFSEVYKVNPFRPQYLLFIHSDRLMICNLTHMWQ